MSVNALYVLQLPMSKQLLDFGCGSISGLANCLSGYVLDTLKVKMQINPDLSMIQTLKAQLTTHGIMHLFNGIYYPLLTVPLVNAVVFGSYEFYKRVTGKTKLSLIDGIQNGAFSGLVNSFIVSPVQLVKCIMQTDKQNKFKTSKECLKYIIKTEGMKGLFKGFFSTTAREIAAYAAQFAIYQQLKQFVTNENHPQLSFSQAFIVGGFAGIGCWISSYPQDIIKTKIQLSSKGHYKSSRWIPDGGFFQCGRQIYRKDGIKGFWRGIQPCLMRAFLANAFGIAVYQQCQGLVAKYIY